MTSATTQLQENDLFGLCSDLIEFFREKHFGVLVYPEALDEMDVRVDKTNLNLIIRGGDREKFSEIIDMLFLKYRVIGQGDFGNVKRNDRFNPISYYLLDVCGKRIKIRDEVSNYKDKQ